mmetsp:Transcript_24432/g.27173  ORF Transcript_24432/g.27173 Transcript_24432/m.27173 type:complete len:262 (-) Transcript_24432:55-840(-)
MTLRLTIFVTLTCMIHLAITQTYTEDQYPGSLTHISVGRSIWGVNVHGLAYILPSVPKSAVIIPTPLPVKYVSVGESGDVWATANNGRIYYRVNTSDCNPAGDSWTTVAGNVDQLSVGVDGRVWAVNANSEVFFRTEPTGPWQSMSPRNSFVEVHVGPDNVAYALDTTGSLQYRTGVTVSTPAGTGWAVMAAGNPVFEHFTVCYSGFYGATSSNQVFTKKYIEDPWVELPGLTFAQISCGFPNKLWGLKPITGSIVELTEE